MIGKSLLTINQPHIPDFTRPLGLLAHCYERIEPTACARARRRDFKQGGRGDASLRSRSTAARISEIASCLWLRTIIIAGDAQSLYEFDLEIASFYCPGCHACYCGEHWVRWNVFDDDEEECFTWHDSIRGRCPSGHQRMLED